MKQSLKFCQEIAELFQELSIHKVSLESVERTIASDHWQAIYQFLQYVYREWQEKLHTIQGVQNTYFCGAWTRYGFHEDGFQSGKDVAQSLLNSLKLT